MKDTKPLAIASCCLGKFRYTSRADANKEVKRKAKIAALMPYRCPFCGFWHVGHKPCDRQKKVWERNMKRWEK